MKAKVKIEKEREAGEQTVVTANVNINGIIRKKTFSFTKSLTQDEMREEIKKQIIKDREYSRVNEFEVEI